MKPRTLRPPVSVKVPDTESKSSAASWRTSAVGFSALCLLFAAVAVQAQTYIPLYTFTGGADGAFPNQNLVRDPAGNLYGVTGAGGTSNQGTVFKLDPAGNETVLHSFAGGADGAVPIGTLIRDAAGNLYGTTFSGGPSNQGTIFKVDTTGTETVLYSFSNGADGSNPSEGLVMDAAGNLYGIIENCAISSFPGCGGVYKLDPNGSFSMLHYFPPGTPTDGAQPSGTLILDKAGNLYGTTQSGGPANAGVVFKIDPNGTETVFYSFGGKPDGAYSFAGLVQDTAGNFYGTTLGGGALGNGTVFKLDTMGNETVLYSFPGGTGGAGPEASVALDGNGNFYGTTTFGGPKPYTCSGGCGVLFKLSSSGKETVLDNFAPPRTTDVGVILDASNNLYGTDGYFEVVFEITAQAVPPNFTLSASGLTPNSVSAGGSATSTIDITAVAGFSGSVALSCSVQPLPALAPTCSISPVSTNPGSPATLTVTSTGPSGALHSTVASRWLYGLWLPLVGLVFAGVRSSSESRQHRLPTLLLSCLLLGGLVSQLACGGNNSSNNGGNGHSIGTPSGSYTVTVTGISGSLQHSVMTTLSVQ